MKVKPFRGIRPPKAIAKEVSSRPYDVLNSEEAAREAEGNPMSLYHIIKPEIDFPVGTSEYDPRVYEKAADLCVDCLRVRHCIYVMQMARRQRDDHNRRKRPHLLDGVLHH